MDNNTQSHSRHHEPGRRYAAGRIRPRAGTDIHRPASKSHASDTAEKPVAKPQTKPDISKPHSSRKQTKASPALPRPARSIVLKRHIVEHAKEHKKKVRKVHRRHFMWLIITATIIVSLGVILWAFQDLLPGNLNLFEPKESTAPQSQPTVIESNSLDETVNTPEMIATHKVATDAPRVLRIPSLEIEARIRHVGVSLSGEPVAPSNIFDAGWFEQNGKPNMPGAVLLNGHSIGPTKDGVFATINRLKPGDLIEIELGNGSKVVYGVVKVQQYPINQVDMRAALQPIDPTQPGLNLMTTSNRYSNRSENSRQQYVVFALQQ